MVKSYKEDYTLTDILLEPNRHWSFMVNSLWYINISATLSINTRENSSWRYLLWSHGLMAQVYYQVKSSLSSHCLSISFVPCWCLMKFPDPKLMASQLSQHQHVFIWWAAILYSLLGIRRNKPNKQDKHITQNLCGEIQRPGNKSYLCYDFTFLLKLF